MAVVSGGSRGRVRGDPDLRGVLLSPLSIAKPSPGSTKMHFSEPEMSTFVLTEAPKHPLRTFTTDVYFQKLSFNLLHIFGKTLGPPLLKNPGSAPSCREVDVLERWPL